MKKSVLATVAAAAAFAMSPAASADVVSISSLGYGLEGFGAFSGLVSYVPGTLTVTLTNDNSSFAGGRITAFAFNIDGNATATLATATHPFLNITAPVTASPYGTFDAGAGLDGNWTGGGTPSNGIAIGATGTFTFNVTGPGAASLTAASFVAPSPDVNFVVRFRGFANGGSDKTPGYIIPSPGAASLVGLGLVAVASRRRRD